MLTTDSIRKMSIAHVTSFTDALVKSNPYLRTVANILHKNVVGPILDGAKPNALVLQDVDSISSSNVSLLELLSIKDDTRITDVDDLFQDVQHTVRLEKEDEEMFDEISDPPKEASEFPAMLTAWKDNSNNAKETEKGKEDDKMEQ